MKRITIYTLLTALGALWTMASFAAVPQLLSLQGSLKDADGNPVRNQTVSVQFTIYDAAAAGTVKWTETQPTVTTNNDGAFSVLLGSVTPVPDAVFDGPDRWLGIKIGGDPEMTPRTRLASGGYAYRVNSIDEASGGDIRGDLNLHSSLTVGDLAGNVGSLIINNGSANRITADGATGILKLNQEDGTAGAELRGGTTTPDNGAQLIMRNSSGGVTVNLDGDLQGGGILNLSNANAATGATFSGGNSGGEAALTLRDVAGTVKLSFGAEFGGGASGTLKNSAGTTTLVLDAADDVSPGDVGAAATLSDGTNTTISLDAKDNSGIGGGAVAVLKNSLNDTTVLIDADQSDAAFFSMYNTSIEIVHLDASGVSGGAQFSLREGDQGNTTISLDAESGTNGGAAIVLANGANPAVTTIVLDAQEATGNGAQIELRQANGTATVIIDGEETGGGADLSLRKGNGTETIVLDADWGGTGFGRIVTSELQISGGADLSEQFEVQAKDGKPLPGMVVSLDAEHPGKLHISSQAYDRRVAGVISGAGDIRPGMLMGQSGSEANGTHPVALTGRVYCWAGASNGAIEPGDLLTTSDTPGYAMKVTDYGKAQGAIIGKAMGFLKKGKGLVLVLVNLQ